MFTYLVISISIEDSIRVDIGGHLKLKQKKMILKVNTCITKQKVCMMSCFVNVCIKLFFKNQLPRQTYIL